MNVGSKITKLRTEQGISLTKLAKISGIAQSSLSYIESGKAQPTVETVHKICTALGITLAEFFTETHEQEPLPPEVRRIVDKVKKLPPEKLKILEPVLDTWIESD
ncbi:helix-turn-helix domain-containing protein [Desulfoscipio geothermicus]|uniref:Transcriptional regulator, contains XRE-family HTH domain n=1 Tax=Desulfoscipio geothermicus DSM 3669 TaxID=1121426 RepID=A0A1I6E3N4_9FIRM|nr:helix-turn-helix transcriptional regulator [Desulfoscipio geothermicus]SFR12345.1 Transcriptional regulator, contains XRE-family HTH domain [Desulfoscipio geothermicus DSM 3669]